MVHLSCCDSNLEYKNVMHGNSDEKVVLLTMLSTDLP